MTPLQCPDCLLSPEGWARLWGAVPELLEELAVYEEMVKEGDSSPETLAAVQYLKERVELSKVVSLCCCPDHVRAVASICVEELLYNRSLRRMLSFDSAADTLNARRVWLVECVRDGCHE